MSYHEASVTVAGCRVRTTGSDGLLTGVSDLGVDLKIPGTLGCVRVGRGGAGCWAEQASKR